MNEFDVENDVQNILMPGETIIYAAQQSRIMPVDL